MTFFLVGLSSKQRESSELLEITVLYYFVIYLRDCMIILKLCKVFAHVLYVYELHLVGKQLGFTSFLDTVNDNYFSDQHSSILAASNLEPS